MPFPHLSPHMKGVTVTFLGGLALSFDIPILRLADGNVWSALFMRSILTVSVALIALCVLRAVRGRIPRLIPGWAGVAVAVLYALSTTFFMLAVFNTSSANVAFILAFNPMFGALLSWIFLRERPRRETFLAMAAMAAGVFVIVGSSLESGHIWGDLSAATSAFFAAGAITLSRASGEDFGFTPIVAAILPATIGAVMIGKVGYALNAPLWITLNGLFLIPFAFWALAIGPKYLSAAETGMFYLLETVLAPVWVWFVFSEEPPVATLIGGAIILIALVWHSTHTLRREEIPPH
ncbi:MAG: DMT family transporter [Rhizobiaceae bacterium]|nr:DMT family transporter [Rhizobiaceae bacterium]